MFSQPPPNAKSGDPARMVGAGAVGAPPVVKTVLRGRELLLLCSDGLHKFVSDKEIAELVERGRGEGFDGPARDKLDRRQNRFVDRDDEQPRPRLRQEMRRIDRQRAEAIAEAPQGVAYLSEISAAVGG